MKERYLCRSVPLQTGPLWSLQLFLAAVELLASTQCTATAWQEASNNFGNKFGWMVGQLVGCLVSWFCGWGLLPSSGRPLLGCWVGRSVSFLVVESVFNRWTVGLSLGHLVIFRLPILWEALPVQLSLLLARLALDQAARLRCTSLKSLPVFHNLFIFQFIENKF